MNPLSISVFHRKRREHGLFDFDEKERCPPEQKNKLTSFVSRTMAKPEGLRLQSSLSAILNDFISCSSGILLIIMFDCDKCHTEPLCDELDCGPRCLECMTKCPTRLKKCYQCGGQFCEKCGGVSCLKNYASSFFLECDYCFLCECHPVPDYGKIMK